MQLPPLAYISIFSALLPIIVGLLFFKRLKPWHLWVIIFYGIYSFVNDEVIVYKLTNHLPYKRYLFTFTIVEYLAFATFLWSVIKHPLVKKAIIITSIAFTLFCLYTLLIRPKIGNFDSVQTSIEAIVVIVFSLIYLFEEINKPQVAFIYSSYKFWIVIGMFLYMAGTFFLFIYASTLSAKEVNNYWIINYISNILKNVLFALAMVVHAKEKPAQKIYPKKQLHVLN